MEVKIDAKFEFGQDLIFVKGSGKEVVLKVNSPLGLFKEIELNEVKIDNLNYELKEGSTIITLKNSYLESLNLGKYKINIKFAENDKYNAANLETSLTVQNPGETSKVKLENLILLI
ncbi:hypothetical protein ABGF48_08255 [Helcococcus bovis]|uniref:hypothetical protein n=1 Tax=Helcococcus bovis TaxID=3153252 RepID=UPI0038BB7CC5